MKLYKNEMKRLSKKYSTVDTWDYDYHSVELTGFFNNDDHVNSGRNRMNTLCKFETKYFECHSINFKRMYNWSSGDKSDVALFLKTTCNVYDKRSYIYIEIRGKDKKARDIRIPERFHSSSECKDWFETNRHIFNYVRLKKNDRIFMDMNFTDIHDYNRFFETGEIKRNAWLSFLRDHYMVIDVFVYNIELRISTIADFVETKNTLKFIYRSVNTYESRPFEIKVKRCKDVETVSLSSIKGETRGYYDHSEHLNIHKSQVKEATKFINRVNKKLK